MNPSPAGLEGVLEFAMIFLGGGGVSLPPLPVLTVSALLEPWWEPGCVEWRDVGKIPGVPP